MQTENAGCYYCSHRCRMLYLISLVCLLSNTAIHEITGPIDSSLSPDQIYRTLFEDVILVLLYILSDIEMYKLEKLRLGMYMPFRMMHSLRLSADTQSGSQASKLAFDFRTSYACGRWQVDIRNVLNAMSGQISLDILQEWHVIERLQGDLTVNIAQMKMRELFGRVFAAQRSLTTSVWDGHIFTLGKLFSTDSRVVQLALVQTQMLFRQLLAYETRLASGECSWEMKEFDSAFIWRHNTVWREAVAYLAKHGLTEHFLQWLRMVFETYYHTSGIENTFKWIACFAHSRLIQCPKNASLLAV